MRFLAVALLSLCAGLEREHVAGEAFEGRWISSATDDRIAAAVITRELGSLHIDLTDACSAGDCALPRIPIALFGTESGPESQHGLGMLSRGPLLTHVTLRLKNEVLYVDTYEFGLGRLFRRHRQSRLIRHVPFLTPAPGSVTPRFPSALFEQYFAEAANTPAYYIDPTNWCGERPNATATVYLRVTDKTSSLMTLRFGPNESVTATRRTVLTPSGRVRVLVALVAYPETVGDAGNIAWQQAQAAVNGDHAAFAKSHGYDKPVIVFENTNVLLRRSEIADPRDPAKVRVAMESKRIRIDEFDALMTIDLDPTRGEGGLATLPSRTIYVGNFGHWRSALDAAAWRNVAMTAYHHEFAHLWGWQHDWSPRCQLDPGRFVPFVTSPALLGWEDLDGDRVPEILDPTPYGRVK